MENARRLLVLVSYLLPAGEGQRHALTLHGKDLELVLFLGDMFLPFTLEAEDLQRHPTEVATEIIHLAMNHEDAKARTKVRELIGWMDVNDFVPSDHRNVLVIASGVRDIGRYGGEEEGWFVGAFGDVDVTYWRFLPELPLEDVEEVEETEVEEE